MAGSLRSADGAGASAHITQDIKDLKDFEGPCLESEPDSTVPGGIAYSHAWNDCISSIRVAPGWRAILYEHEDFEGDLLDVTAEVPNLRLSRGDCDKRGFNDCVTSIRVFQP